MTTQRLISDARRRAKTLARTSGRPYQSHLDELAISAGRADWAAFLADPSALPPEGSDRVAPNDDGPNGRTRLAARAVASTWLRGAVAATIALAAILVLSRTRASIVLVDAVGPAVGATIVVGAALAAVVAIGAPAMVDLVEAASWSFPASGRDRPSRAALAGLWRAAAARSVVAAAVLAGFAMLLPLVSTSVPFDAARTYASDRASARTVQVQGLHDPIAIVAASPDGPAARRLVLAMVDQRLSPPYLRGEPDDDRYGPSLRRAFARDGVLRTVGVLDCADHRYRIARFQAAASFSGPATADVANPTAHPHGVHLSGPVVDEVCGRT